MLTYFAPAFQDDPDQVKIIACSGAVTGDVYFDQQKDRKSISTAQRDQLRDVDGPGAVLLTFGGNDIGFADIITKCIGLGTCSDDEDWVTSVATRIAGLRSVLASTYASLWRAANTDEDVAARDGEYAPSSCSLTLRSLMTGHVVPATTSTSKKCSSRTTSRWP